MIQLVIDDIHCTTEFKMVATVDKIAAIPVAGSNEHFPFLLFKRYALSFYRNLIKVEI